MLIEPACLADLDEIVDIERHSFPRPWPRASFEAELTREHAHLVVARDDFATGVAGAGRATGVAGTGRATGVAGAAAVRGFANFWIVAGEVHIHSIATHPDHRRQRIGGRLLAHLLHAGRTARATLATLEVRRGNLPAIALYGRAGFETVTVRTGYYQDNQEDALVMTALLG